MRSCMFFLALTTAWVLLTQMRWRGWSTGIWPVGEQYVVRPRFQPKRDPNPDLLRIV